MPCDTHTVMLISGDLYRCRYDKGHDGPCDEVYVGKVGSA